MFNRNRQIAADTRLIAGIEKHLNKGDRLVIAGKKYTAAQVAAVLQGRIDKAEAVAAAKVVWLNAVAVARTDVDETKPFIEHVRQALLVMFAASPEALADFGIAPRKTRREIGVAEKALAAQKAQATRKARNTLGKRQRLSVTGAVPAGLPRPSPEPTAPAPTASPPVSSGSALNGAASIPQAPA